MNALLIYMIKVAVYLAGFYLVYRFLLSRDTMYGRNRALYSVFISALILPFAAIATRNKSIFRYSAGFCPIFLLRMHQIIAHPQD